MRNFSLLMVAALMCSMVFGQSVPKQYYKLNNEQGTQKVSKNDGWYGCMQNPDDGGVAPVNQGYSYYMVGSAFAKDGQIEKVKFYHYKGDMIIGGRVVFTSTCTNYTIGIFENPILAGEAAAFGWYDTNIGEPVYTQTVTFGDSENENDKWQEVTLDHAYTIPSSTVYWIGIKCNNGLCACLLSAESDPACRDNYYIDFYSQEQSRTFLVNNEWGDEFSTDYLEHGIAFYATGVTAGVSNITPNTFKVYPNPSTGVFNVSVKETSTVNVYDVTGKLVNTAQVNAGEVYTFTQTTAGMYFVNVNGRVEKMVIK